MATETWRWQGGTSGDDSLLGATVGLDGSCILAGYTMENADSTSTNSSEWMVVKLDADGSLQWQWQGGVAGFTPSDAEAMAEDGSVVMVGNAGDTPPHAAAAKFDENGTRMWEWQDASLLGTTVAVAALAADGSVIMAGSASPSVGYDFSSLGSFAASKLNADGELVWGWQDSTSETDKLQTAVVGDDDSVVLAGYTFGTWSGVRSGEMEPDFAAVKLDADANELWRWQGGSTASDNFVASAMGQDGSVVLAGVTTGTWRDSYIGGTYDFAAVKLDSSGDEIWRWQGGTMGDDVFIHAAAGDEGPVALAGWTNGAWGDSFDNSFDFAAVKLDANGNELWRWQGGSAEAVVDKAIAIAAGYNDAMILAGSTVGSWTEATAGGYDFAAIMLDTGPSVMPSPPPGLRTGAKTLIPGPTPTDKPTAPLRTSRLETLVPAVERPSSPTPTSPAPTLSSPTSPRASAVRQPTFLLKPTTPARAASSPTPVSPTSAFPGPTSPASTAVATISVAVPAPGLPSPARALTARSSEHVFSPINIGIVSAAATLSVVIAGVVLGKTKKARNSAAM